MSLRTSGRWIGALFIIASTTAIVGGYLVLPVEEATLQEIVDQQPRVVTGVLLEMVLVGSVVGIAALFFPILRRQDEGLAIGYVGARIIEAVLLLIASLSGFVIATVAADPGTVSVDTLVSVRTGSFLVGSMLALGVGGMILYSLLYRSRILPTWLTLWGLAGALLIIARAAVEMYGVDLSGAVQGGLAAPIAVNEMVLAVWLLTKGFDESVPERPAPRPSATRAGVSASP